MTKCGKQKVKMSTRFFISVETVDYLFSLKNSAYHHNNNSGGRFNFHLRKRATKPETQPFTFVPFVDIFSG